MCARICNVMHRQQVDVDGPAIINSVPNLLETLVKSDANCLFVMASGVKSTGGVPAQELLVEMGRIYSDKSKVIAIYLTDSNVLKMGSIRFAAATLVSNSDLTQKEAALFYPEFFSELANHSQDGISLAVVRFCHAKANRFAPGKVEIKTGS